MFLIDFDDITLSLNDRRHNESNISTLIFFKTIFIYVKNRIYKINYIGYISGLINIYKNYIDVPTILYYIYCI